MAVASAAALGSIAAGQTSAACSEHHIPKSEEADDAGEDDDRTTNVVIEGPGSCGEDRSPNEDGDHDPAEDLLGLGDWGRGCHEPTIGPCPAAADAAPPTAQKKGPRNGPDPRGAGNLNRFRERLDGADLAGAVLPTLRQPQSWADSRGAVFRGQGLLEQRHRKSLGLVRNPGIELFLGVSADVRATDATNGAV